MTKISKQAEKDIKAYLNQCSKLKGAALREAYAEVVGRDTNETSRERLLNGIARVLYHNAEQGSMVPVFEHPATDAKPESKKEGKKAKGKKSETPQTAFDDVVSDAVASSPTSEGAETDAAADAAAGDMGGDDAGPDDGAGSASDAADGARNANDGASAGATADDADGEKKRRVMRPRGERDPRLPPAGTVLKKTYKGVLHEVKLLQDNGCIYEGKQYGSLSGVAKVIAGCNHNGLLFFGLAKRESKAKGSQTSAGSESATNAAQPE